MKPRHAVLNRGHPLSRGLLVFWPMTEGGGDNIFDVVRGAVASAGSGVWVVGQSGFEININDSSSQDFECTDEAILSQLNGRQRWTVLVGCKGVQIADSPTWNIGTNVDSTSVYLYTRNTGSSQQRFRMGATNLLTANAEDDDAFAMYHYAVTCELDPLAGDPPAIAKLYAGGRLLDSAATSAAFHTSLSHIRIGGYKGGNHYHDNILYFAVYLRPLSLHEIKIWHRDPWTVLRPAQMPLGFVAPTGAKTATGGAIFPVFTLNGVGEVGRKTATGGATFPVFTLAGVGEVGEKTATGGATFPVFTLNGTGEVGRKTATGGATFPVFTLNGVGEVGRKTATGGATFPVFTLNGVGVLTGLRTATGGATFPVFTLNGIGEVGRKTATGGATFPIFTLNGVGDVSSGKTATGGATFPVFTLNGVGEVGRKTATGGATFPVFTLAGVGEVGRKTATGGATFPVFTLAGVGAVGGKVATGGATFPLFTLAGVGEVGRKTATGGATFPVFTLNGVGVLTGFRTATGGATFPVFTLSGVGAVTSPGKTATGGAVFPVFTVAGIGVTLVPCIVRKLEVAIELVSITDTERDAISSPGTGLLIHSSTQNKLQFYNGASWQQLTSAAAP
jgi:hypothetical protein